MYKRVDNEHDRWWMVRAGDDGKLFHHMRRNEVVAMRGAIPAVDFSDEPDVGIFRRRLAAAEGGHQLIEGPRFDEIADFVVNMREGDIVVTPSADAAEVLIRTVGAPPEFRPDDPHGLVLQRRVRDGQKRAVTAHVREILASLSADVVRLNDDAVAALRELVRPSRGGR
jgi:predicted Mrr-cat superfamily restriction endonuclease